MNSPTLTRALACLAVATLCLSVGLGTAAGASLSTSSSVDADLETNVSLEDGGSDDEAGDENSSGGDEGGDDEDESDESVLESTSEDLQEAEDNLEEGSGDLEDTVEDLRGDTVNSTTDTNSSSDTLDSTVSNTTEPLEAMVTETITDPSSTLESVTGAGETLLGNSSAVGGVDAALTLEGEGNSSDVDDDAGSDSVSENAAGDGASSDRERPESGIGGVAGNAVLVGLMGSMVLSGAGAGVGAAGGAGGTAAGASAGGASVIGTVASLLGRLFALVPSKLPLGLLSILGYSRYDDSDPLENDRRRVIFETVDADPGRYLSAVSEASGVPLSTVRHHVRVLEDEGLITSVKVHGKRRYFPAGEEATDLEAALAEPAKRRVLEALAETGPVNNGSLAAILECDPSTISHHLSTLEGDDLIVRKRDGRSVVNELAPSVEAQLLEEGTPGQDSKAVVPVSVDG